MSRTMSKCFGASMLLVFLLLLCGMHTSDMTAKTPFPKWSCNQLSCKVVEGFSPWSSTVGVYECQQFQIEIAPGMYSPTTSAVENYYHGSWTNEGVIMADSTYVFVMHYDYCSPSCPGPGGGTPPPDEARVSVSGFSDVADIIVYWGPKEYCLK